MVQNLYVWFVGENYDGNYICIVADSVEKAKKKLLGKNVITIDNDEKFDLNDRVMDLDKQGKNVKTNKSWKSIIDKNDPEVYGPLENGFAFGLSHLSGH